MTNCFAIRNGRTINTSVSLSMAKASLPCGRKRQWRTSGMGAGEIVAGFIGLALLVYLAYALVFPEKF
jgi:K+-transporting ATPase KdpF subunit